MHVAVLTARREQLQDFAQGLGRDVEWIASSADVLGRAKSAPWSLVVVDSMLPDLDCKAFLIDLMRGNAMINTAVLTDMDEETFHDSYEGLGVLCHVAVSPKQEHGRMIMEILCRILGITPAM